MTTAEIPGPRPQPIGALPWPAGMLLIPPVAGADEAAAKLLQGQYPDPWPTDLAFLAWALDDEPAKAAATLTGDDLLSRYNRAVLLGGDDAWSALAQETSGDMRALVDTCRYSVGLLDDPPELAGVDGEVAAVVHSARASAAIERGDPGRAVEELTAGVRAAEEVGSNLLAATLRLTAAEFLRERLQDPAAAARQADAALQQLPMTADREVRAQLQVTRALARQELAGTNRGALLAVVADLTEATKVFREDSHPELFALCNHQLALAYLVMPMSSEGDRIRVGVAVNSLRAALKVYTPETHPVAWASSQVNLANALQYLPSVHQESNLDEAVQLYEEVLQVRDEAQDPLGYARLLANQGNALGHLGVFGDARVRLERAQSIFRSMGDDDSAASVAEILESLGAAEAEARADAAAGSPSTAAVSGESDSPSGG